MPHGAMGIALAENRPLVDVNVFSPLHGTALLIVGLT